tara:strand:+ start:193 stop:657 length:465 start_codon:yes stop_codon:yes gene_type:complete
VEVCIYNRRCAFGFIKKIVKKTVKGVKSAVKGVGKFVKKHKKSILTAGLIAGMVFTGGALAGAWGTVGGTAASTLATAGAASPGLAALGTSLLGTGVQTGLGVAMQKIEGTPEQRLFGQNPGLNVEGAGMARQSIGYQPTQIQYGIDGISVQAV